MDRHFCSFKYIFCKCLNNLKLYHKYHLLLNFATLDLCPRFIFLTLAHQFDLMVNLGSVQAYISAEAADFSSSLCVQTCSGADPVSYPMGTADPFPGGKVRPGRDADHSLYLVLRSRMSNSYISSPLKRPHVVLWDCFTLLFTSLYIIYCTKCKRFLFYVWGSHNDEYKDSCLLGNCTV
jgi:hypothetical protein